MDLFRASLSRALSGKLYCYALLTRTAEGAKPTMKKSFTRPPLNLLFFCLLFFCSGPVSALNLFGFGQDEAVIWESGVNRYIKYTPQDSTEFGPNEHPVTLNREELELALLALQVPDDGFFAADGTLRNVFTVPQIKLLSKELPRGFGNARPDQDIILALEKDERKLLGLQDKRFLAARAFFKDGRLNIIIGEHDFFRSKAFESVYDPSGRAAVPYDLNNGARGRASGAFSGLFMSAEGIENKLLDTLRHDWFVIDIKQAASGYLARRNELQNPVAQQDQQLQLEAARMARQRREMRAEMARMRKAMRDLNKPAADARSIEARIQTLDQLREKGLISQAEYDMKRREILNDI